LLVWISLQFFLYVQFYGLFISLKMLMYKNIQGNRIQSFKLLSQLLITFSTCGCYVLIGSRCRRTSSANASDSHVSCTVISAKHPTSLL